MALNRHEKDLIEILLNSPGEYVGDLDELEFFTRPAQTETETAQTETETETA